MIAERLGAVLTKLTALAKETGRPPARLVAVSKTMPSSAIMECYDAGQRTFGENYAQEICEKASQLPSDIKWHFIGHLQTNKVKNLVEDVPNLWCVESVSSEKVASQLDKRWGKDRPYKLNVFIQINTSEEESKDGVEPEKCSELVKYVVQDCSNLKFCGLMTIGKLGDTTSQCFDILAGIREGLLKDPEFSKMCPPRDEFELSMGMSGDFELAIKCGATNVRIGSTIFGSRPKKEQSEGYS
jgi:pyridoxal phosphate enzyme (YggS family)